MATENMTNVSEHTLPVPLPSAGKYSAVAILLLVCWIVPLVNLYLLVTVCQGRQLRRPLYILMANVFVADFLLAIFAVPLNVSTLLSGGVTFGRVVCYLQAYVTTVTIATSSLTIGAMSVCRLLQVCYPVAFRRASAPRWLAVICSALWIYPLLFALSCSEPVEFVGSRYACNFTGLTLHRAKPFVIYFPIVIIVPSCYVKIYAASRQISPVSGLTFPAAHSAVTDMARKRDHAVFRSIMVIFAEFLVFFILPSVMHVVRPGALVLVSFVVFRVHLVVRTCTTLIFNRELRTEARAFGHKLCP